VGPNPDNASSSEIDPIDALAEEFQERRRRGERPTIAEYVERFPELADGIRTVFGALVAVEDVEAGSQGPTWPGGRRIASPGPEQGKAARTPSWPQRMGDFCILREIGRGGMGVVYEAEQESLGRRVALKVLPAALLHDPYRLERFQREARAAAGLHHTNIVPVYCVGQIDGVPYYAMQYIPGRSLEEVFGELRSSRKSEMVASGGHEPPEVPGSRLTPASRAHWITVARIGRQVADALAYAHAQGVLHRDIKPANLLLDPHDTVWVTDFGLAKAGDSDNLTQTGNVVGTLRYLAPERFSGPGDARSDVCSLGLTLYELATLRPAYQESDRNQLVRQVIEAEPPAPRSIDPGIPADLETIVLKAIARDPAHRYPGAAALRDDLGRFLDDRPIQARRIGSAERLWRWCRRNRALAGLAAAVAVLLCAITALTAIAAVRSARTARTERANRLEIAHQVALQHIASAARALEEGDVSGAALFNALALQADRDDPNRAEQHRIRLGLLLQQTARPAHVLFHPATVRAVDVSPDGRWIAAGCTDGNVQVWDFTTGEPVGPALGHPGPVEEVRFGPGGRLLVRARKGERPAISTPDSTFQVRIWDVASGKPLTGLLEHHAPEFCAGESACFCLSGRCVLVRPSVDVVHCHDFQAKQTVRTLQVRGAWITQVLPSPDDEGRRVLIFSQAGQPVIGARTKQRRSLRIWDLAEDRARQVALPVPRDNVEWLAAAGYGRQDTETFAGMLGPDGRWGIVVHNGTAVVFDARTGQERARYAPKDYRVESVRLSPSGRRAVAELIGAPFARGSESPISQVAQVWAPQTGQPVSSFVEHGQRLEWAGWPTAAPRPEVHETLLTRDGLQRWCLHSLRGGPLLGILPGPPRSLSVLGFSPDGLLVLTQHDKTTLALADASTGRLHGSLWKHDSEVVSARFSPDGSHVLAVCGRTVRLWPVRPRVPHGLAVPGGKAVQVAEISPDGRSLLTMRFQAAKQGAVWQAQVWDARSGAALTEPVSLPGGTWTSSFSPDGARILFALIPADQKNAPSTAPVLLEIASGGQAPLRPDPHLRARGWTSLLPATWSPDGRFVLLGALRSGIGLKRPPAVRLQVFDATTGQPVHGVLEHAGVIGVAWAPNSRQLLLVRLKRTNLLEAELRDARTGEVVVEQLTLTVPSERREGIEATILGETFACWFSRGGERLILAHQGKQFRARAWDTATARPLGPELVCDARLPQGARYPYVAIWGAFLRSSVALLRTRAEALGGAPDGRYLYLLAGDHQGNDRVVRADLDTGEVQPDFIRAGSSLSAIRPSPDGQRLLLQAAHDTVLLHDANTGEPLVSPLHHPGRDSVAFAADGLRILTLAHGNTRAPATVRIWDSATGLPLTPLLPAARPDRSPPGSGASRDLDRILIENETGWAVLDLTPEDQPADDLRSLAEVLSCRRGSAAGTLVALSGEQFERGWREARLDGGPALRGVDWHRQQVAAINLDQLILARDASMRVRALCWHLDRLIAAAPNDPGAYYLRARTRLALGWWQAALDDVNRAAARGVPRVYLHAIWLPALAELGRYREAIPHAEALPADSALPITGELAMLYLAAGDSAKYDRLCRLARAGLPVFGHQLLVFVLSPTAKHDWVALRQQVESNAPRADRGERGVLAGIHYRAGRFKEVRILFGDQAPRTAIEGFFLAMAWKLDGDSGKARAVLRQAIALQLPAEVDDDYLDLSSASRPTRWPQRLAEEVLRHEAEGLIGKP
jgi:WD40 repeat protein/tRNA A-37 threonylcarbamoyl transferase component Bud32